MHSDPIADMLTRIRNAQAVKKETVLIPFSKINIEILKLLKKNKLIADVQENNQSPITVQLGYRLSGNPKINSLKRISKPGRRLYMKKPYFLSHLRSRGIVILSTNKGIMTNKEAQAQGVGGEVICEIY